MLQNVPKMLEITRAVAEAVKVPVTVKRVWDGMPTVRSLLTLPKDSRLWHCSLNHSRTHAGTDVYG